MTVEQEFLPLSWAIGRLGDVADAQAGFGFPERFQGQPTGDYPFAKVGDISRSVLGGRRELSTANHWIKQSDLQDLKARTIPVGSTVFAKIGEAIKLNRRAIVGREMVIDNNAMALIPYDDAVDPRFLFQFMQTVRLLELCAGNAVPAIRKSDLVEIPFPLAPLPEQRRIVAKLDALQSRTRLAREALAAIPALLDHYRQSVLAAAFLEASPAFAAVLDDGEPATDTPVQTLLAACDPERGIPYGIVQTGEPFPGGVPTVRCGDIKDFSINLTALKPVDPKIIAQYTRTTLKGGEVLIAIRGSVGQVSVASPEMRGMNISREVAMIPVLPSVDPWFVCYFLSSPLGQRQVLDRVKGVAQQGINLGDLHKVLLPSLTPAAQQNVVAAIRRRLGFIKIIENQITGINVGHLDQSILATAFRGELVPQDPTDEPASALLDRIRAARADADQVPRTRRPRAPAATPAATRAAEPAVAHQAGDPYSALRTALRKRGSLANSDAQDASGLDAAGVRPLLQRLVAEGHARVERQKRSTRYVAT